MPEFYRYIQKKRNINKWNLEKGRFLLTQRSWTTFAGRTNPTKRRVTVRQISAEFLIERYLRIKKIRKYENFKS